MSATTPLPTDEQKARARWDLLLADLEYRQDQMRLARQEIWFKPWHAGFLGMAAAAGLVAAGAALVKLLQ